MNSQESEVMSSDPLRAKCKMKPDPEFCLYSPLLAHIVVGRLLVKRLPTAELGKWPAKIHDIVAMSLWHNLWRWRWSDLPCEFWCGSAASIIIIISSTPERHALTPCKAEAKAYPSRRASVCLWTTFKLAYACQPASAASCEDIQSSSSLSVVSVNLLTCARSSTISWRMSA